MGKIKEEQTPAYCQECNQDGAGITVIRAVNNTYNERLKVILAGANTDFTPLDLGCPSSILLETGLPNLPIQIAVNKLMIKKDQDNHPFKLLDVIHLPEFISTPIAIFRSATKVEDVKVVLTEMECDGVNIVVIISPNQYYKGYNVNSIRSLYPKDNIKAILGWIAEDNLLEYAHKEKFLNWLGKQQSNSADVTRLIKDSAKIIEDLNKAA